MTIEPRALYEFGPFQVDPDRQLLLRESESVAITPKAFEMLLILLRHNREVVTKDELMKALWPDSFVEETNLSQNIFRLRKALGDASGDQRYIVTVPGRGYRFTAQVRRVTSEDSVAPEDLVIASRSRAEIVFEQAEASAQPVLSLPPPVRPRMTLTYLLPICALLVLLIAGSIFLLRRNQRIPEETQSVLVADFTNFTGDPVFDSTLREGLSVQLEQSPFLSLVPGGRIQQELRLMGQPADVRLTGRVARDVCERVSSDAVLEGSITRMGNQFVLGLRSTDCRTGRVFDDQQVQAAAKESVLNAVTEMAAVFRRRAGESTEAIGAHNIPLEEATTPSLEALKAYSTGFQITYSQGEIAGLPFFERAVEIDPKFAMAYAALGIMHATDGEPGLAAQNATKAYELRDRTSDRERFFITAGYERRAIGNQEKAQQTCETWAQTYPRDFVPHSFLAASIYPAFSKYDLAITEADKAIQLSPGTSVIYAILGYDQLYLDRVDDAEATLRLALERGLHNPTLSTLDYDIAFFKHDKAGMELVVTQTEGHTEVEDYIDDREASRLADSGRVGEARTMSRKATEKAQQAYHPERAALMVTKAALWESLFGNVPEAKRSVAKALGLASNREVLYGSALALALSGDSSRSERIVHDLEQLAPEDTFVHFSYLPTLRATLALNRGDPSKALEDLQAATPYELGIPRSATDASFGALYPVYLRGEAYLAAHRGTEAVNEFKKILNHRGIVLSDPIGAVAYLQLGRAYVLAGDKTKAVQAYQSFLTLWKDADPEIPLLKEAKAEFARL